MKNKKINFFVLMILICMFSVFHIANRMAHDKKDKDVNNVKMNIYSSHDENTDNADHNIQDLTYVPQCFMGTWVMTAELHGQDGWVKPCSDIQNLTVKFTPTVFCFQNDHSEVSSYSCSIIAIENINRYYHEAWQFRELGLEGDYYLILTPKWDKREDQIGWFSEYVMVSETELIIPDARTGMYKMRKVEEYPQSEYELVHLIVTPYRSICYGVWEVTERIGKPCQSVDIGYKLGTWGTTGSFEYCRVLNRKEKPVDYFAKLTGLGNGNKYFVYCKFSENYFWDYMIIKDGMTAVLVKGEYIYQVKRISDPEKDCIYEEFG